MSDLSNLPPALFTSETKDPLLDDSLFMYTRWLAAGNDLTIALCPGGIHAFNGFPIELANQANARVGEVVKQHV